MHGGPGAAGEMAPVAKELALDYGVLEPLQTVASLKGQVDELETILKQNGDLPVILIGFSWGAWLSLLLTASYPSFVKKLLLVGCGPFKRKDASEIQEVRLNRLSEEEKRGMGFLLNIIDNPWSKDRNRAFARFGAIISKADAYHPISLKSEEIDYNIDIFQAVWKDAEKLRERGEFGKLIKNLRCPVVAIHGDYDPHPADGVKKFLCSHLKDFRFILLENCGHKPWIE